MRLLPWTKGPRRGTGPSRRFSPTPRSIVVAYLVLAAAWIVLTGQMVRWLFVHPDNLTLAETLKGWTFVAVTTGLLAVLLTRYEQDREQQRAVLAAREREFRLLAERARDVIFRYRVHPDPGFEYVSPSVETALGYPAEALMSDPSLLAGIVHPDDPSVFANDAASIPEADLVVARLRAADGRWVPFEINIGREPAGGTGSITVEGVARDISERQRAEDELLRLNRVRQTMSEVNRSLVRATSESELLDAICKAVVDEGKYRFAWVGLIDPATGRSAPRAYAGHEAGYLTADPASAGPRSRVPGPLARSIAEGRPITVPDIASDPLMAPRRDDALARGYASMASIPLIGREGPLGTIAIYAGEPYAFGPQDVALLQELAADLSFGIQALRDRATHEAGEAERRLLATAVTQSHESIVLTDANARIEYVNPAFERVTGYSRAQVLGENPSILQSGVQSAAFYAAMWESLLAGRPWIGDLVNRRRNGEVFVEEAVISPVLDRTGATSGYVAVKRDVTAERATEARAQAQARERALIADALEGLRPEDTAEETSAAICRQVSRLPEVSVSWLVAIDRSGGARMVAAIDRDGNRLTALEIGESHAAHLLASARLGPWVEPWPADEGPIARDPGGDLPPIRHAAYAPVRVEGDVVGLLGIGSADPDGAASLTERLPALAEFARIAGAVLGPSMSHRAAAATIQARIRAMLDTEAFHPVFQPIIQLVRGEVLGVEALTRFDDGTPPDQVFRDAARYGLGLELEQATATAALAAACALPPGLELSLNVSPTLVTTDGGIGNLLREAARVRPIVLEVTEHEEIGDYAAFSAAIAALGPTVRLAVDDAGAGFASMRHIVELRPSLVKVDRSLIAGIDHDSARQALLVGFQHLTDSMDCQLLAEGIETEGELESIRAAGLRLGQGYLLGCPVPIGELRLEPVFGVRR